MTDRNQAYMQNVKIEEIPWHRLATAYGRTADFPEYFNTVWNMADLASVETALGEILYNIEHQGTLWHSTPFAMIFLVRAFGHAIPEIAQNACAEYIVENLLDFFELIVDCFYDCDELEYDAPVPDFSDMLQEDYLWSEVYDEEEDFGRYEEGDLYPDGVFYSFWYYSYQTLFLCKPMLKELKNTSFRAKAEAMEKILSETE